MKTKYIFALIPHDEGRKRWQKNERKGKIWLIDSGIRMWSSKKANSYELAINNVKIYGRGGKIKIITFASKMVILE